ncbi:MAG: MarR family transcriptional regulator [Solirubrobacterales bacterium]|nr:MarR family transcriptional regulator [Solirubrobacterales bacterium]
MSAKEVAAELLALWHFLMKGGAPALYRLLDELDLSMTQIKTLHALDDCGRELSVKDLAEKLGMSVPNASRTADTLLKRGYLERREDEHDRRMRRVGITAAGREAVERIDTVRLQNLQDYAETLTPEQRTALHASLSSLPHKEHCP